MNYHPRNYFHRSYHRTHTPVHPTHCDTRPTCTGRTHTRSVLVAHIQLAIHDLITATCLFIIYLLLMQTYNPLIRQINEFLIDIQILDASIEVCIIHVHIHSFTRHTTNVEWCCQIEEAMTIWCTWWATVMRLELFMLLCTYLSFEL
jgi:hypothetical protein